MSRGLGVNGTRRNAWRLISMAWVTALSFAALLVPDLVSRIDESPQLKRKSDTWKRGCGSASWPNQRGAHSLALVLSNSNAGEHLTPRLAVNILRGGMDPSDVIDITARNKSDLNPLHEFGPARTKRYRSKRLVASTKSGSSGGQQVKKKKKKRRYALSNEERKERILSTCEELKEHNRAVRRNRSREIRQQIDDMAKQVPDPPQHEVDKINLRYSLTNKQEKLLRENKILNCTLKRFHEMDLCQLKQWLEAAGYNPKMPPHKLKTGAGIFKIPSKRFLLESGTVYLFKLKRQILKRREELASQRHPSWWENGTIFNPADWELPKLNRWVRNKKIREEGLEYGEAPDCSRHASFLGDFTLYHPNRESLPEEELQWSMDYEGKRKKKKKKTKSNTVANA
mmetsp:Transcript_7992/g.11204  ORF Transcript_7992/g.11204 Transcript_7992/m.11204 type:complete len:398 (+) Transcript_7992:69-1262(+)